MSLNLQAIHDRAEHARQWTQRDPCNSDGFLPLPVREHFDHDVPALVAEVVRLRGPEAHQRQLPAAQVSAGMDDAMSDAELDEWIRAANDDVLRVLDETTDTEAGPAWVKRVAEMPPPRDLDQI